MFRGLLNVRLKAAEQALRDGRLDDAVRMAREPAIADHARGGRLLGGLSEALLERARGHYRAERFTEALLDLGKVDECGGQKAEATKLREQVLTVAHEVARLEADRKRRLEEARRCVRSGSIAAGKRLLLSVGEGDPEIQALKRKADERERRAADLVAQAETLLKRNRLDDAVEHLVRARGMDANNPVAMTLESRVCDLALTEARLAFDAGRLVAARGALAQLKTLGGHRGDLAELADLLELAGRAAAALGRHQYDDAQQHVCRLLSLSPKTKWIAQANAHLQRIDEALLGLTGGPLGEREAGAGKTNKALVDPRETVALPRPAARPHRPESDLADKRLLLLVDGGGSYLLLRGERVGIGRASTDTVADMPILADLGSRHANIARVEDDYFLMSEHEMEVAGRRTKRQLLNSGDRVVLARRAKFTFSQPNRRSASARLDISDSTKMPNDVRRVILFKETAMIGRSRDCHITCRSAQQDVVLYERAGGLWVRPKGTGGGEAIEVVMGQPVEIEGVSFAVQPWTTRPAGMV